MTDDGTIELAPDGYIARGNGSMVFRHPTDPGTLLKIPVAARPERLRRRLSGVVRPSKRRFGGYREWFREYDEYIAAIRKAGALPGCLPAPRGFVQTTLGPAFAVEMIRDLTDGALALTVEAYLDAHDPHTLRPALDRFFEEVARLRIVFFDLRLYNLCVVRDGSGVPVRVVAIDSIGENTLLGVRKWSALSHRLWLRHARADFMRRVDARAARTRTGTA